MDLGDGFGDPSPPADSAAVRVGLFIAVSPDLPATPWTADDAAGYVAGIVEATDAILVQCNLHLEVETASVITLPESLLDIQGNEPGSFGGHPPAGTENVELFNYEQNETLTAEVRKVFEFAKSFTTRNAISAITVRDIEYYAEGETVNRGAGGLSFPPNNYHRAEDYPARNSVLLVPDYGEPGALPATLQSSTWAHELGHMLLNAGDHSPDPENLMNGAGPGTLLTSDQCASMRSNLEWLFGDDAVADPGPPT